MSAFDAAAVAANPVAWLILLLALGCYSLMLDFLLSPFGADWRRRLLPWLKALPVLLGALPLLGLLGTIAGLSATFNEMSLAGADRQDFLSGGIADALLTTQLGLTLVVPGWLLLATLKARYRRFLAQVETPDEA